jgi:hypothetical protein
MRMITGWFLIAFAAVFIPTPLPLGAMLFAGGLAVLGPRDPIVRWGRERLFRGLRVAERGESGPLSSFARRVRSACLGMRVSLRSRQRRGEG